MLNLLSKIKIIDNTGARSGIMIKKLQPKTSTKNTYATIGNVISYSVRKTINQDKIKRKKVYKALIVRTKKKGNITNKRDMNRSIERLKDFKDNLWNENFYSELYNNLEINSFINNNFSIQKLGGHSIIWDDNAAILIKFDPKTNALSPIGTRIKGPICESIKYQEGCMKIASIGLNI